jgi:hypothetical protein
LREAQAGNVRAMDVGLRHLRASRKDGGGCLCLYYPENVHDLRALEAEVFQAMAKGQIGAEKGDRLMRMLKQHREILDRSQDLREIEDEERERWLSLQRRKEEAQEGNLAAAEATPPPHPEERAPSDDLGVNSSPRLEGCEPAPSMSATLRDPSASLRAGASLCAAPQGEGGTEEEDDEGADADADDIDDCIPHSMASLVRPYAEADETMSENGGPGAARAVRELVGRSTARPSFHGAGGTPGRG